MASYNTKVRVKSAVNQFNHFDLSCQHITTMDWMRPNIVYYRHVVPGQSLSVDCSSMARLAPMPVPTYGRADMHLHAFYVPYSQVFKGWQNFITNSTHTSSADTYDAVSHVPTVTARALREVFEANDMTVASTDESGIAYLTDAGTVIRRKLTALGRQTYKILRALGYDVPFTINGGVANMSYNALPILAFAHIYVEYFFSSQYYGTDLEEVQLVKTIIQRDYSFTPSLGSRDLLNIFRLCASVNYMPDYFTSAFDTPTGAPINQIAQGDEIIDIQNKTVGDVTDDSIAVVSTPADTTFYANTPVLAPNDQADKNNLVGLSQYMLNSLKALTLYVKRHNLVGSRPLERFLARFGVTLRSEVQKTPFHLGSASIPMMVRDVTATNETGTDTLGSYAGQGIMKDDNFHFSLDNVDDFGVVIVVASIVPTIGYPQVIDRHNLHVNRLDFFTPEFDALGTQPIAMGELLPTPLDDVVPAASRDFRFNSLERIFGFAPRYAEYKCSKDIISGDFLLPYMSQSGMTSPAWHLQRYTYDTDSPDIAYRDGVYHSPQFVSGADASQFNRIFYDTNNDADHFAVHFYFNVSSQAPMMSLYDDFDMQFTDEHNKEVTVDINGTRMN